MRCGFPARSWSEDGPPPRQKRSSLTPHKGMTAPPTRLSSGRPKRVSQDVVIELQRGINNGELIETTPVEPPPIERPAFSAADVALCWKRDNGAPSDAHLGIRVREVNHSEAAYLTDRRVFERALFPYRSKQATSSPCCNALAGKG
jgi:hypothetical protein